MRYVIFLLEQSLFGILFFLKQKVKFHANGEKISKYCRDVRDTKADVSCRGLINVPNDCNCMPSSKIKANNKIKLMFVHSGSLIGYIQKKN